ncbi:MAG: site-2 protease family protein [Anaerolineae bacterium]
MLHPDADNLALDLRTAMAGVFDVRDIRRGHDGRMWEFYGHLTVSATDAIHALGDAFGARGFTPFLFHDGQRDVVIAYPFAATRPAPPRWGLSLFLFLVTLALLTVTGALVQAARIGAQATLSVAAVFDALADHGAAGFTFAASLMLILGAHEMGHYLTARRRRMSISLPYFLPAPPPPWGLGTLGAFIAMRGPAPSRRALFDMALAGPLAGLAVALPLLIIGLRQAAVASLAVPVTPPLLAGGLAWLLRGGQAAGAGIDWFDPVLFAAWLGVQLTAINLLPIGQLDGGHVAYAALGRHAIWLGRGVWVGLVALVVLSPTWGLYAVILAVVGLRHPPPQDDITPIGRGRWLWAAAALILLILTFSPRPLP